MFLLQFNYTCQTLGDLFKVADILESLDYKFVFNKSLKPKDTITHINEKTWEYQLIFVFERKNFISFELVFFASKNSSMEICSNKEKDLAWIEGESLIFRNELGDSIKYKLEKDLQRIEISSFNDNLKKILSFITSKSENNEFELKNSSFKPIKINLKNSDNIVREKVNRFTKGINCIVFFSINKSKYSKIKSTNFCNLASVEVKDDIYLKDDKKFSLAMFFWDGGLLTEFLELK